MISCPPVSRACAGMPAAASLEPSATLSLTPLTRFQNWSTERTVSVKAVPACCGVVAPSLPSAVPPRGDSPGSSTWSLVNGPGFTAKLLLDPMWGGAEKSATENETAPPAPLNTIGQHRPRVHHLHRGHLDRPDGDELGGDAARAGVGDQHRVARVVRD